MTKPLTAAQRKAAEADIAAQRAKREAAANHVADIQPDVLHADLEDLIGSFELPSWKRVACGIVLGLLGAGVVGYGIGMIMAYALAGIATLAGAGAIAFIMSVLVWVIGIYASWKIGGYVGGKIFSSVVLPEGLAARSMASLSNAVAGAGDRVRNSSIVQRAQSFTGAHVKVAA